MSATTQLAIKAAPDRRTLAEMLHVLSQPLTSLHCILEMSLDHNPQPPSAAGDYRKNISAALCQTDRAIAMVQQMREYLEAEPFVAESKISASAQQVL